MWCRRATSYGCVLVVSCAYEYQYEYEYELQEDPTTNDRFPQGVILDFFNYVNNIENMEGCGYLLPFR
jgi:hypothetical protein